MRNVLSRGQSTKGYSSSTLGSQRQEDCKYKARLGKEDSISKTKLKEKKNKEKGTGDMSQFKYEELSWDPQNPCEKLGTTCNPCAGEMNSGGD